MTLPSILNSCCYFIWRETIQLTVTFFFQIKPCLGPSAHTIENPNLTSLKDPRSGTEAYSTTARHIYFLLIVLPYWESRRSVLKFLFNTNFALYQLLSFSFIERKKLFFDFSYGRHDCHSFRTRTILYDRFSPVFVKIRVWTGHIQTCHAIPSLASEWRVIGSIMQMEM